MLDSFEYLPDTLILSPLSCFSKKRLFEDVADQAAFIIKTHTVDINMLLNDREKCGSTALDNGVASSYPNISGIAPLKEQASRFVKAFLDIDVKPEGCIPTVGSMMGTFASFIVCTHLSSKKDTILFINPGFSVQPLQAKVLGYKREAFDVYDCRGERLRDKLESILAKGHIAGNLNVGNDKEYLLEATTRLLPLIGYPKTLNAIACLNEVAPESNNTKTITDSIPENLSAFPVGGPNPPVNSKFFIGQSYLAQLTKEKSLNCPIYNVTFEPGCRNNWHSHTGGQILIAVGGKGLYQERGKEARLLMPGDIVEIVPNVEHWHGATPDSWFSHLAIECNPQTNKNTWLEAVDDTWYLKAAGTKK